MTLGRPSVIGAEDPVFGHFAVVPPERPDRVGQNPSNMAPITSLSHFCLSFTEKNFFQKTFSKNIFKNFSKFFKTFFLLTKTPNAVALKLGSSPLFG